MANERTSGESTHDESSAASSAADLTPHEFIQRWAGRQLTERASAQPHFTDLCRMLGVPAPTDNRIHDSDYGFEARTDISASGVYATLAAPRLAPPVNDDYYE